MILKVANEKTSQVLNELEPIQHESISKNVLKEFERKLAQRAQALVAEGKSVEEVAVALKLDPKTAASLASVQVEPDKSRRQRDEARENEMKMACGCEAEDDSSEEEAYLSDAEKAYDEMYGKKKKKSCNDGLRHAKSVMPSKACAINNTTNPTKFYKGDSNNSIWEPNAIGNRLAEKGNDERIREEKQAIADQRKAWKNADCVIDQDKFLEMLKAGELKSASSIVSLNTPENYNYGARLPQNGISIFDNPQNEEAFVRIASETAGEKAANEAKNSREKKAHVYENKTVKSSDIFRHMIDSMTSESKE